MLSRSLVYSINLFLLVAFSPMAKAEIATPRFCVVPVKGAEAGVGPSGDVWRHTFEARRLPGVAAPIFLAPGQTPPSWTIDASRNAVPYPGVNLVWGPFGVAPRGGGPVLNSDGKAYKSEVFHRTLVYERGFLRSSRWRQSTPDGLEDIPGGDIQMWREPDRGPNIYVRDLPTLGRTVIDGNDGLFLFDGSRIKPIQGAQWGKHSDLLKTYDLTAIGHVLVVKGPRLYELTRDGALVDTPLTLSTTLVPGLEFVDWPTARVALVSTQAGMLIVDRDLQATSILGGDQVENTGPSLSAGEIDGTGDLILIGRAGVFLAVDTEHGGIEACERAQNLSDDIPQSDLCLRPVAGTDEHSIGFFIGGMIEAPGNNGLLLDTVSGLFIQKTDGPFVALERREGAYTRNLVRIPGSDQIVTVGLDSEVIHADLSRESTGNWLKSGGVLPSSLVFDARGWTNPRDTFDPDVRDYEQSRDDISRLRQVANGDAEHIGDVLAIAHVDFAGFDIVTATSGTFAYQAGRLTRISDLSPAQGLSKPVVLPNLRRVLLKKHYVSGPLLFELARRSSRGECSVSLADSP